MIRHPVRPCDECPWRRDQPAGRFPPERYEQLAATSRTAAGHPELYDPLFACHKSREGRDLACAGWLAVAGVDHVRVRLAAACGHLDPAAMAPGAGWPPLYDTFQEMAAFNGAEVPS